MAITVDELNRALAAGLRVELNDAANRVEHCFQQLTVEQIWSRPRPEMNSLGNLILHVCGNLRQWIIAGVAGTDDTRKRQSEFDERGPIPIERLLATLRDTINESLEVIDTVRPERLAESLRIQGFEVTGIEAIIHSVAHLRGHVQETIHATRFILGDDYQFAFVPTTPEQGASGS